MAKMRYWLSASVAAALLTGVAGGAAQAQINDVIRTAQQATQDAAAAQRQIDDLDDDATDMELQYRALQQQIESQRLYIEQQRVFLQSQQNEIASLEQQIGRVDNVGVEILPMMRDMVQNLENFVNLDLPFNVENRQERIANLYEDLDDPEISAAERYRLILNAYDIEASYGRQIDSYEETIDIDGVPTNVTTLRIGRVALIRDMPNGDLMAYTQYNGDWERVSGASDAAVTSAFRIAQEVTTPDLFTAPIPGSEDAQ